MAGHRWLSYAAAAVGLGLVFGVAVIATAGPDVLRGLAEAPQCRAATRVAEAVAPLARGQMAALRPVTPADVSALPFDGTGESARTLGELSGRVTLLNLWATWCAPCRAEMPELAGLHEARSGENFAVVATSIDDRETGRPERFLEETGAEALTYHREPTLTLFNSLRQAGLAPGMPTTLIIAPDGCVAATLAGAAAWNGPDALRVVDAAIAAAE